MAEADIVNGTFKCPTVWCVVRVLYCTGFLAQI